MITRLDAIEKRRLSARDAVYWGDNQALVDYVLETDMPLLMSVAEAAAEWHKARKDYERYSGTPDSHDADLDLEMAEEVLIAAIAPLLEEVTE